VAFEEVTRPWGTFKVLYQNPEKTVTVKLIKINPGSQLSLQLHHFREEQWTCVSGVAKVILDGKPSQLEVGEQVEVPIEMIHRLGTDRGAAIIELSRGRFDEEDVFRLEDDYNRAGGKGVHS
jgi:mannose-6-phosphate isomerase